MSRDIMSRTGGVGRQREEEDVFFWLSGSQAEAQNKENLKRLYSIRRLL
jgi:hypothetical protein